MRNVPALERKSGEYVVPGMSPCGPLVRYMEKVIIWSRNNDMDSWAETLCAWIVYAAMPIRH